MTRRGPPRSPNGVDGADAAPPANWGDDALAIAPEHRAGLAAAEADAAYRWAAGAARDRDVLDVGSGAGHGAALMLAAGARSVLGADHDEQAVEAAARLYGERVRFVVAEPMALPLAPGSFDAVTCFEAIGSAPDPDAVLRNLRRVLTADGVLLLALPTGGPGDPVDVLPGEPRRAALRRGEEWRGVLAESFRNVRLHRRGLRLAATVADAADGSAVSIDEVTWLSGDPGEERSVLALASDAELPELASVASLTGFRDLRSYRATLAAWEARARRSEAEASAKHWEMVAAREAQRRLRKQLHRLEHRPLRVLSRVLRGKPARLGPGPPIRASERAPEPWD